LIAGCRFEVFKTRDGFCWFTVSGRNRKEEEDKEKGEKE